jgi:hypothetical protein
MSLDQTTPNQVDVLAVDPNTPRTLCAGTEFTGVFESTDSGATWSAVNNGLPGCFDQACFARALAIDPGAPGTLYVDVLAMVDGQLSAEGVFKSRDGGNTWDAVGWGEHGRRVSPSTAATWPLVGQVMSSRTGRSSSPRSCWR